MRRVAWCSSRMRWIMIGTTTSAVASFSSIAASVASGSNLRRSTKVEDRISPRLNWRKPQAWNSGAANTVGSRARSGMRESSATIGSMASGWPRLAPFGVPVLPEVSSVILPGFAGAGRSDSSPRSISSSTVISPWSPSSSQAMKRLRSPTAFSSASENSSS